jgi:hypothetical protein
LWSIGVPARIWKIHFFLFAQLRQALNQFRVLDWIERHVDLLVLFQFHYSAFVNDASKVQYAVVIEIIRLQRCSLLAARTAISMMWETYIP